MSPPTPTPHSPDCISPPPFHAPLQCDVFFFLCCHGVAAVTKELSRSEERHSAYRSASEADVAASMVGHFHKLLCCSHFPVTSHLVCFFCSSGIHTETIRPNVSISESAKAGLSNVSKRIILSDPPCCVGVHTY